MRKSTETRETLLETAIELIWQSNYASVGIADICEKAGTTKGAFYHHFDSKATLFYEATLHYWEKLKLELDAIYSPERGALEQLEGLIAFVMARQGGEGNPVSACPFFTSGAQCGTEEEKVRQASAEMCDRGVRYNVALAKNLQSEGLLASPCDPQDLGPMMYQFTQGLLLYGRVHCELDGVERTLREGLYRLLDLKPEHRRPARGSRPRRRSSEAPAA